METALRSTKQRRHFLQPCSNNAARRYQMALVTIGDVTKEYPNGTTYLEIAEEYQPQYEDDILLVRINGKLRELHKKVKFDCRLEFFTGRDQPGIQTYHRSTTFLMLKAFYDVVGAEKIDHPSSVLLWRRRWWILLLIHAEKTFPRNIKTAVRIFRAAVFWCNRAISCYTKIPPGRLCAPGRRRYITASDSSPAPARPADFLHFPRGRDFCPVFSLRTRRQFHILHCHL